MMNQDDPTPDGFAVLEAIARTLWLSAYAEAADRAHGDGQDPDPYLDPDEWDTPGPGEDWDDYAPDTPIGAVVQAERIADAIANRSPAPIGLADPLPLVFSDLAKEATRTDALSRACGLWIQDGGGGSRNYSAEERFGHCIALQCLGHGVGVDDDTHHSARFRDRIFLPYCEAHTDTPDGSDYHGSESLRLGS